MTVNTKSVAGRRNLRYESYDQLWEDAQRMADTDAPTIGNWSKAQIFKHLALSFGVAIDGADFKPPWLIRFLAPIFMKKKFLYKSVPSGFKIPDSSADEFVPQEDVTTAQSLADLRAAIDRLANESTRADHPVLGKLTNEEWDQFNFRHAEMHMSFIVDGNG